MTKLLDTLSEVHKKDRASGGTDFDMSLTHIMADAYKPKFDKTVKNITINTMKNPTKSPSNPVSPASVSDFTATMIEFHKYLADEWFNVIQLFDGTMTGLFPEVNQKFPLYSTYYKCSDKSKRKQC